MSKELDELKQGRIDLAKRFEDSENNLPDDLPERAKRIVIDSLHAKRDAQLQLADAQIAEMEAADANAGTDSQ